MIPYVVMMVAPLAGYIFARGNTEKQKKLSISIFFSILLFLLMFRSDKMGSDIISYKFYFDAYKNYSFFNLSELSNLFSSDIEPLFLYFNWIVARFTSSFRVYLMVVAIVSIVPIWLWYRKRIEMPELTLALFLAFEPLVMYVSGIRQGIAMAFVPIVYKTVKDKAKLKFFILVVIASLIHFSALAMIIMYPLYYVRLHRKKVFLLTGVFAGIYLFRNTLYQLAFKVLVSYMPKLDKYSAEPVSTGAFAFLLLLALLLIYCYLVPNENELDEENIGMRNFLVLCFLIQNFASISFLIMRLSYYYLMFIPILIPAVSQKTGVNRRVAYVITRVLMIGLTCLFFIKGITHRGSSGQYFPYIFMWND